VEQEVRIRVWLAQATPKLATFAFALNNLIPPPPSPPPRYFATLGTYLLYYSNPKKVTVLAALPLLETGEIAMYRSDVEGRIFCVLCGGKGYFLKAGSRGEAKGWVKHLNVIKERGRGEVKKGQGKGGGGGDRTKGNKDSPQTRLSKVRKPRRGGNAVERTFS
jgi:hypothetical protein